MTKVFQAPADTSDMPSLRESGGRGALSLLWSVGMLTLSGFVLVLSVKSLQFQGDFNGDVYAAGLKILRGLSPYDVARLNHQAAMVSLTGATASVTSPRWPMPALLAASPLSLLPVGAAEVLFFLICTASVIVCLRMLGVRDSRCVLIALVSTPTVICIDVGNVSTVIMLGLAIGWRFRSHVRSSATTTAILVVGKLFLWPLGVWLLITRRYRSAALAGIYGTVAVAVAWSTIGITRLPVYPTILRDVATIGEGRGCSLVGFLMYLGAPINLARMLALASALLLLLLAAALSRNSEDQTRGFGLVILAALTATPVVWSNYLVILFVPIALISPELSWLWFLPSLAVFAPTDAASTYGLAVLPTLLAELALALALCKPLMAGSPGYWRSVVATAKAAAPS